jgi:outer membrane protein OmpA-like peptidoglycan-associated protein
MLWPVPINVRMNPVLANHLLDINAQCASEEREIFDFPEYGSELNEGQRTRLKAFAQEIIRSHDSMSPIAAISIIGHADRALKEPKQRQAAKEQEVSDKRAANGQKVLEEMMKGLPGGNRVLAMTHMKAEGRGAKELKIKEPLNEEQRRRNRRIVFKWSRCLLPAPIIHPIPEFPKPDFNPEDDPNTVFAGTRFKMKILSGVSAGEVLGGCSYHFLLVDVGNKRSAEYRYKALIVTVGVPPFTECGESDFSNEFTTANAIQVDQFTASDCAHESGSAALVSGMRFAFGTSNVTGTRVRTDPSPVSIFAGPSKSLGVESAKTGSLAFVPGTIAVFKG